MATTEHFAAFLDEIVIGAAAIRAAFANRPLHSASPSPSFLIAQKEYGSCLAHIGNRFPCDAKSPSQFSQRNIAVRAQFSEPARKVLINWFVHDFPSSD
jgi:hypothetical protein